MISILKLQVMLQSKYFNLYTIFSLFIGSFAWPQFSEINTELDMRRLSEGDRQLFSSLAEDIEN